jgi:hypothetical protein
MADLLVAAVADRVTETIWIGKLNRVRERTAWIPQHEAEEVLGLENQILRIEGGQTDEAVMDVVRKIQTLPEAMRSKVRWKDSYQEVIDRHDGTH